MSNLKASTIHFDAPRTNKMAVLENSTANVTAPLIITHSVYEHTGSRVLEEFREVQY